TKKERRVPSIRLGVTKGSTYDKTRFTKFLNVLTRGKRTNSAALIVILQEFLRIILIHPKRELHSVYILPSSAKVCWTGLKLSATGLRAELSARSAVEKIGVSIQQGGLEMLRHSTCVRLLCTAGLVGLVAAVPNGHRASAQSLNDAVRTLNNIVNP